MVEGGPQLNPYLPERRHMSRRPNPIAEAQMLLSQFHSSQVCSDFEDNDEPDAYELYQDQEVFPK